MTNLHRFCLKSYSHGAWLDKSHLRFDRSRAKSVVCLGLANVAPEPFPRCGKAYGFTNLAPDVAGKGSFKTKIKIIFLNFEKYFENFQRI